MAGHNYSSTVSKFTPFSSGIQDHRLGFATNVVLMQIKDENLGEQSYFSIRPSFDEYLNLAATSNGKFLAAAEDVIATTKTFTNCAGETPVNLLGSAAKTEWDSCFNAGNRAGIVLHDYTASTGKYVIVVGNTTTSTTATRMFVADFTSEVPVAESATVFTPSFVANKYPVSMDGYLFLAEKDSDTIYNSDLNDYTTWDLDVQKIRATQFPGNIVALSRINNYVVAFKENSLEFFYNAGLSDTSPLERNTSYTKQIGLYNTGSLVSTNNTCYFVGKDQYGSRKVFELTETKCDVISTPLVDAYIADFDTNRDSSTVNSFYLATNGKRFYVLQNLSYDYSVVYDIKEKVWYMWTTNGKQIPARFCKSTTSSYDTSLGTGTTLIGETYSDAITDWRSCFLLCSFASSLQSTVDTLFADSGFHIYPIEVTLYLPPSDFGTVNRKFAREISVSGFWPEGAVSGARFLHTITMNKYAGGENKTVVKTGTNRNNMNFKNWGQFINMNVVYSCKASLVDGVVPGDAQDVRLYGINYDVSMGVS